MKKTLLILTALAMVFGMAMNASAATVQVTLTSPTITKAPSACEKAGAVTFSFPQGSTLSAGDWWYMDLPEGATLCKPVDYMIVSAAVPFNTANNQVFVDTTLPTSIVFAGATANANRLGGASGVIGLDTNSVYGPIVTKNLTGGADTIVTGNLAIRVIGAVGSRRVTVYVASDAAGGTITVQPNSQLDVKILDGAQYNAPTSTGALVDTTSTRVITNSGGSNYAFTTMVAGVFTPGKYAVYGQDTSDTWPGQFTGNVATDEYIGAVAAQVPYVENTLCVSAEKAVGNLFVSFASLNDKFTFTGDSQIAHVGTGNAISLKSCLPSKSAANDLITIGGQGQCSFNYDSHAGYCKSYAAAVYLESDSVFGELNDLYDVALTSKTAGVYFKAHASVGGLGAFTAPCTTNPTAIASTTMTNTGVTFAPTTSCTVANNNKSTMIWTTGGAVSNVHNYKYLVLGLPTMVYDTAVIADGTEVVLNVTLNKYPCGQIFSDDITIGTFVVACSAPPTGATTLLYPYLIGTGYSGWFSGYVITNGSSSAGTATLTAVDEDGNSATFTTPEIAGMGTYNASFMTDADWTQAATNTANFTMAKNFVVKVACKFNMGSGMAFIGNTVEGYAIGYRAASNGALQ
jgi:hypothetical protein